MGFAWVLMSPSDKHDCFILSPEGRSPGGCIHHSNNAEGLTHCCKLFAAASVQRDKIKVGLEATTDTTANILGFSA